MKKIILKTIMTYRCGKCRRYIKLVETKPIRLHCVNCDETFAVPQNGIIREFHENRCPLDDYQLLMWSGGAKGKSFTFCPYCYNNPPFPWVLFGLVLVSWCQSPIVDMVFSFCSFDNYFMVIGFWWINFLTWYSQLDFGESTS